MINRKLLIPLIVLTALALGGFFISEVALKRPPEITSISQYQCLPGEKILIEGRGFGDGPVDSMLFFGDREIKGAQIELWEPWAIRFRVPSFEHSALIQLVTPGGESQGILVYHREGFPQLRSGSFLPGHPYVEYLDPSQGAGGQLITLQGYDFGYNRMDSSVWINAVEDNHLSYFDLPDPSDFVQPNSDDYQLWENDKIQFYLPDQVHSGFIYIKTSKGFSNPVYLEISPSAGTWDVQAEHRVMLNQSIVIDQVGALPGNQLFLWLPRPSAQENQSQISLLQSSHGAYLENNHLDVIALYELGTSEVYRIERILSLQVQDRIAQVDPATLSARYQQNRGLFQRYTAEEQLFPTSQSTLRSIAVSVGRGYTNPYYKAEFCYAYIQEKLTPMEGQPDLGVLPLLQSQSGDSWDYSRSLVTLLRILGVPSRMVAGVALDEEGSRPHFWVEAYLENFGWFPMDPYMADLEEDSELAQWFWGGQDSRRIAFSRGSSQAYSLTDQGISAAPQGLYSLQSLYEEKEGLISSYRSRWIPPMEIPLEYSGGF